LRSLSTTFVSGRALLDVHRFLYAFGMLKTKIRAAYERGGTRGAS
jgi:hypothetical protein